MRMDSGEELDMLKWQTCSNVSVVCGMQVALIKTKKY